MASRSTLPEKLGEMLAALARMLETHMRALDPTDTDSRKELDAYAALVTTHRDLADRLSGIADQMAGYRALPLAAHDVAAMSDAVTRKAFENFVRLERELTSVLGQLLHEDQEMLREMSGSA